jgi:hypothetical protein
MGGPEQAPEAVNEEAAAAKKMGDVMPPEPKFDAEVQDRPIDQADLDAYTKGYPEIKTKPTKEQLGIINMAKKFLADANHGTVPHYTHHAVTSADGYEYIYVRDIFNESKDRLFKSEEPVVDLAKDAADAALNIGYEEVDEEQAVNIAKAVKKILKGKPPSIIVDKADLIAGNLVDESEASNTDWNVAYAVKINDKIKIYFGWEKKTPDPS